MSEVTGVEKNTEPQFKFCWVIALRAEAAPLIDAFNMKVVENKSLFPIYANEETGPEIANRCVEAGAFVTIAHPQWSGLSLTDARSIKSAHAVEVYNHGCAVSTDRPDGFHTLDLLLAEGRKLNLVATDDAHFSDPDYFGGWVMVKSNENSPDSILEALKEGTFYSSQGPDLVDIEIETGSVEVHSTPVSTVIIQGQGSAYVAQHGEALVSTQLSLERLKKSPWLRVTIIDHNGKRAWSNPIWRP